MQPPQGPQRQAGLHPALSPKSPENRQRTRLDAYRTPKALTAAADVAWSHLAENQDHSVSPRGSKRPVKCLEEGSKVTAGPGQGGGCRTACPPLSACRPHASTPSLPTRPPTPAPTALPQTTCALCQRPLPSRLPKLGGQGEGPQVMFAFLFYLLDSSGLWGCGSDPGSKFSSPGRRAQASCVTCVTGLGPLGVGRWAPEVSADRV